LPISHKVIHSLFTSNITTKAGGFQGKTAQSFNATVASTKRRELNQEVEGLISPYFKVGWPEIALNSL
jgi:hypothetical protein